jgi:hypothetical protein
LGKVIDAFGHMRVWPVPKDGECGTETEAERKQREARAQFVKPFLREQFVSSTDKDTSNRIIETSVILVAEFGATRGVSLERTTVAVIDAMMDDYAEINNITGASIATRRDFSTYIKGLNEQSRRGRPLGPSNSRSYTKNNFWQEEEAARQRVADKKAGKTLNKDVADEMGISEWLYYDYKRKYR